MDTLKGGDVNELEVSRLNESPQGVNQLLRCLDILNYADDGLKALKFYGWRNMEEPLNDQSLQNVVSKCQNVERLEVANMGKG